MTVYLATSSSPAIREAQATGRLGRLCAPGGGAGPDGAAIWAADNACFGKGYPGDAAYLAWLAELAPHAPRCLFATAPDVVGEAQATLDRSAPFLAPIRALGYPVALVAQDGLEHLDIPWDAFDVLFIGGTTDWKLSQAAADLAHQAHLHGKTVHLGRVNSRTRYLHAARLGAASCDGTFLSFGPDANLPRLLSWLDAHESNPMLTL